MNDPRHTHAHHWYFDVLEALSKNVCKCSARSSTQATAPEISIPIRPFAHSFLPLKVRQDPQDQAAVSGPVGSEKTCFP
jgi:hypothetical protein